MKFSKKIVVTVLLLNVVFTVAVFSAFWHTGSEPQVLIGAWFAFTTGELWALGKIKRAEIGLDVQEETEQSKEEDKG